MCGLRSSVEPDPHRIIQYVKNSGNHFDTEEWSGLWSPHVFFFLNPKNSWSRLLLVLLGFVTELVESIVCQQWLFTAQCVLAYCCVTLSFSQRSISSTFSPRFYILKMVARNARCQTMSLLSSSMCSNASSRYRKLMLLLSGTWCFLVYWQIIVRGRSDHYIITTLYCTIVSWDVWISADASLPVSHWSPLPWGEEIKQSVHFFLLLLIPAFSFSKTEGLVTLHMPEYHIQFLRVHVSAKCIIATAENKNKTPKPTKMFKVKIAYRSPSSSHFSLYYSQPRAFRRICASLIMLILVLYNGAKLATLWPKQEQLQRCKETPFKRWTTAKQ